MTMRWSMSSKESINQIKPITPISVYFHPKSKFTDLISRRCFLSRVLMSTGARDCLGAVSLSFNGNAKFKTSFSRWLQTGKVAEICDLWFSLGAKASWSKVTNGKENYRVLPRRNLRRLEQLERIYGSFPLVDQRAASLECPTFREKTVYIKTHKTTINRPVDLTGET